MADIPTLQLNAPGVPPLIRGISIQLPALVFSDIFVGFSRVGPQWGVFLNGQEVVLFDTFLSVDYRKGWSICDYPIERGQFETYNKVNLPYDMRVRFASGGSLENRAALIAAAQATAETLDLYDVVTPEAVYTSCNVQHINYHRTQTDGAYVILFDMWLQQVRVTEGSAQNGTTGASNATDATATNASSASPFESSAPPLSNTFDPSGMSTQSGGLVQATPPTSQEQGAFDALATNPASF